MHFPSRSHAAGQHDEARLRSILRDIALPTVRRTSPVYLTEKDDVSRDDRHRQDNGTVRSRIVAHVYYLIDKAGKLA